MPLIVAHGPRHHLPWCCRPRRLVCLGLHGRDHRVPRSAQPWLHVGASPPVVRCGWVAPSASPRPPAPPGSPAVLCPPALVALGSPGGCPLVVGRRSPPVGSVARRPGSRGGSPRLPSVSGGAAPCPTALTGPWPTAAPAAPPGHRPAPPGWRQRFAAWSARPAASVVPSAAHSRRRSASHRAGRLNAASSGQRPSCPGAVTSGRQNRPLPKTASEVVERCA